MNPVTIAIWTIGTAVAAGIASLHGVQVSTPPVAPVAHHLQAIQPTREPAGDTVRGIGAVAKQAVGGGQVTSVTTTNASGSAAWDIQVVRNGQTYNVTIDRATGQVLQTSPQP